MARLVDFSDLPSWFVVLPDCESASTVAASLRGPLVQEIKHPSGRPWLLGRWPEGAVTVGKTAQTKVAVMGQHAVTAGELTEVAGRISTTSGLDHLGSSLVGSSHLVASVRGTVRVQGSLNSMRRVYHAEIARVTVASDRADVLACLLDAPLDVQRLAVHLLDPLVLHPVTDHPLWQGVRALEQDHYLVLDHAGGQRAVKWWAPPEPTVPMADGAPALREALVEAVGARVGGRDLVSCDLGGLDSTSVCSLAAHREAKVVAYTLAVRDPLGDDVQWASRTVAALGNVEHHVIPAEEMPLVYDGLLDMDDRLDEPCTLAVDRNRWLALGRRAEARGSRLHLTGFGGDELLYGHTAHLHTLLRTNPRVALGHLRGFSAKYGWRRREAMRQLLDNRPYRAWLSQVADTLTAAPPPMETPTLDWGTPPRLPPWATPAAVDAVAGLIRAEARSAEPVARRRGHHAELVGMQSASRMIRQLAQMAERIGVTLAAPYYDDRVIEAGLAVRPEERVTPWRYKPLILEAMRGIVPEESLGRQTKVDFTCDEDPGLRENRADLLELCEDSRLGRLGLIDANALRAACSRPLPPQLQIGVLYQTVACEVWLRALESVTAPSRGGR